MMKENSRKEVSSTTVKRNGYILVIKELKKEKVENINLKYKLNGFHQEKYHNSPL